MILSKSSQRVGGVMPPPLPDQKAVVGGGAKLVLLFTEHVKNIIASVFINKMLTTFINSLISSKHLYSRG